MMGERLNYVCIGDRLLRPAEYRDVIRTMFAALKDLVAEPVEVLRIGATGDSSTSLPWEQAGPLFEDKLGPDEFLFCYFIIRDAESSGRQSMSVEARKHMSVVSLSLNPGLCAPNASDRSVVYNVLSQLVGWALANFGSAALACGPELDLYEAKDELDLRQLELRLSLDWRCWSSAFVSRRKSDAS